MMPLSLCVSSVPFPSSGVSFFPGPRPRPWPLAAQCSLLLTKRSFRVRPHHPGCLCLWGCWYWAHSGLRSWTLRPVLYSVFCFCVLCGCSCLFIICIVAIIIIITAIIIITWATPSYFSSSCISHLTLHVTLRSKYPHRKRNLVLAPKFLLHWLDWVVVLNSSLLSVTRTRVVN